MKKNIFFYITFILFLPGIFAGCTDFLDVDTPKDLMDQEMVFNDDATAVSAVTNIYTLLRNSGFLAGNNSGIGLLMGCYTDELQVTSPGITDQTWFYQLNVVSSNGTVKRLWDTSYQQLYQVNAAIEGLEKSQLLTIDIKEQLLGECYFVRALLLFYLNRTFGEVPYVIKSDYEINKNIARTSQSEIDRMLTADLETAVTLLKDQYPSSLRTRPNRSAAYLLLARISLYSGNWNRALETAKYVMDNTAYSLENIDKVFYADSRSTVWHLRTLNDGASTFEVQTYFFESVPPPNVALADGFIDVFSENDLRKSEWIRQVEGASGNYAHSYKYKRRSVAQPMEFSVVLRIEEAYFIIAEANVRLGHYEQAAEALNDIRNRAGLTKFFSDSTEQWLDTLLEERRKEFFTEFGHRFYDLKRTGQLDKLQLVKPQWISNFEKLPLPESELQINPNLLPQNTGY
ncbi:SusD family protein [Sphingobacterium nematocida]|uniref:SusD family protein n=1 Tax=Sphingobacterium nematocida TaxID=1513896 RepID=A0A1T5GQL8_9SPHI|nr:RagB/SusD family nutrient uptake outer membrane protein [Sphingobacterium nematocida]SKC10648.1 SusD family protein [Sphingobacterium nematocida]